MFLSQCSLLLSSIIGFYFTFGKRQKKIEFGSIAGRCRVRHRSLRPGRAQACGVGHCDKSCLFAEPRVSPQCCVPMQCAVTCDLAPVSPGESRGPLPSNHTCLRVTSQLAIPTKLVSKFIVYIFKNRPPVAQAGLQHST